MRRIREYILSSSHYTSRGPHEDMAEAALYFASDRSAYVTGTVLPVDGGLVAGNPENTVSDRSASARPA